MNIRLEPLIRYFVIVGLTIVFVLYIYKKSIYEPRILEEKHRFTIGEIIKIEHAAEGGRHANYQYFVKGKFYLNSIALDGTLNTQPIVGQRYFVKYYFLDPTIADLMLSELVSDSLLNVPIEGWEIIPVYKRAPARVTSSILE
jgi:hypothetical protein